MWPNAGGLSSIPGQGTRFPRTTAKIKYLFATTETQSGQTLQDTMDYSPPGSSVHGDSLGKNTGVGCHDLLQQIFPTQGLNPGLLHCRWILYHLSHQRIPSWATLCDPMDCSPPESSVHGILQARILEWVATPFSRGSSQPRDQAAGIPHCM